MPDAADRFRRAGAGFARLGRATREALRRRAAAETSAPIPTRISALFREEARHGRRRQLRGRFIAIAVVAVLATVLEPFPGSLFFYAILLAFYALGRLQIWADDRPWRRDWHAYLYSALDCALLVAALMAPNPLTTTAYPPQMELRFDNFIYLVLPMIAPVFTYQPRLVLWIGAVSGLFWSIGVAIIASLPDSVTRLPEDGRWAEPGSPVLEPTFVHPWSAVNDVTVLVVIAALLAAAVARTRRLVWRYAELERERANLARFFPPSVVDRLASQDGALLPAREVSAAVMFVDIVGFSTWSEGRAPSEMIATLREVLGRLEAKVFAHGGALEKFTGDGLLATFGALSSSGRDATDALACALAIADGSAAWNAERRAAGGAPIELAIGLAYGPLIVGDVGTARRLELTVLGDTVNLASRLEKLTRTLEARIAVGDGLVVAVRAEALGDPEAQARSTALLGRLGSLGPHAIRGRQKEVEVWSLGPGAPIT